jgi:FkbM family methyltransferase
MRRATFAIPRDISLGGEFVRLSYPDEHGTAHDFLSCIIEDHYGLCTFPSAARTILDIGANVGFFSLAARSYFPDAVIHAYEPNPRLLSCVRQNAAIGRFVIYPEAVGSEGGRVSIVDDGDSNQARTVARDPLVDEGIQQVPLREAIARLGDCVDLAKIDCEGAEWDLFHDRESWRKIHRLRMEYHLWRRHTFAELTRTLHDLGFSIDKHVPSGEFGLVWCTREARMPASKRANVL